MIKELDKLIQQIPQRKIKKKIYDYVVLSNHGLPHQNITYPIASYTIAEELYRNMDLPVKARSLFTWEKSDEERIIVVRGYDKFFNVNEVKATEWKTIENDLQGPFEVSVKENGCIIYVGTINGHLVVTSKHAVYNPAENEALTAFVHSKVGNHWVEEYLKLAKKTRKDLADYLSKHNVSAAFELADDSFEEHVLDYPPGTRGLYLHGVNENKIEFETWPLSKVKTFADLFGFSMAHFETFQHSSKARSFIDQYQATGTFRDRFIEGFVVRAKRKDDKKDFFFKVKFDVPYLLFREWREVTNQLLLRQKVTIKTKFSLTEKYIEWTKSKIKTDPLLFSSYLNKNGIIKIRNLFLKESEEAQKAFTKFGIQEMINNLNTNDPDYLTLSREEDDGLNNYGDSIDKHIIDISGLTIQSSNSQDEEWMEQVFDESSPILLIPVACVGCGKTTTGMYLSKLFNIGHVQNDNYPKRTKNKNPFLTGVMNEYAKGKLIVFADKNNHTVKLRKELIDTFKELFPRGKVIALDWKINKSNAQQIYNLALNRINERGQNHRTLKAGTINVKRALSLSIFSRENINLEDPSDSRIDQVISIDCNLTPRDMVKIVCVEGLKRQIPDENDPQWISARNFVENYDSTTETKATPVLNVSYFSIPISKSVFNEILKTVNSYYSSNGVLEITMKEIEVLKRIVDHPHITLAFNPETYHGASLKDINYFRWYTYRWNRLPLLKWRPTHIVFNTQLICIAVEILSPIQSVNKYTHITIGTVSENVKHVVSNYILETAFGSDNDGTVYTIPLEGNIYEGKVDIYPSIQH